MHGHHYFWLTSREEEKKVEVEEKVVPVVEGAPTRWPVGYWMGQLDGVSARDAMILTSVLLKSRTVYAALVDVLGSLSENEINQNPQVSQLKNCLIQMGFITPEAAITSLSYDNKIAALNEAIKELERVIPHEGVKGALTTAQSMISTLSLLGKTVSTCCQAADQKAKVANTSHALTLALALTKAGGGLFEFGGNALLNPAMNSLFDFLSGHEQFFDYFKDATINSRKMYLLKNIFSKFLELNTNKEKMKEQAIGLMEQLRLLSSNEPWSDDISWRLDLYRTLDAILNDPQIFAMLHNLTRTLSAEFAKKTGQGSGAGISAAMSGITFPLTAVLQYIQYVDAPSKFTQALFAAGRMMAGRFDKSGTTEAALHAAEMTTHWFQVQSWISFLSVMPTLIPTVLGAASEQKVHDLLGDRDKVREALRLIFQMALFNYEELLERDFDPSKSKDRTAGVISFKKIEEAAKDIDSISGLIPYDKLKELLVPAQDAHSSRKRSQTPVRKATTEKPKLNPDPVAREVLLDRSVDGTGPSETARLLNVVISQARTDLPHLHLDSRGKAEQGLGKTADVLVSGASYLTQVFAATKQVPEDQVAKEDKSSKDEELKKQWEEKRVKAEKQKELLEEKCRNLIREIEDIRCPTPIPENLETIYEANYKKIISLNNEIKEIEKSLDCYQARIVFNDNAGLNFREQKIQEVSNALFTKMIDFMFQGIDFEYINFMHAFEQKTPEEKKEMLKIPFNFGRAEQFTEYMRSKFKSEMSDASSERLNDFFVRTMTEVRLNKKMNGLHFDRRRTVLDGGFAAKIAEFEGLIMLLENQYQNGDVKLEGVVDESDLKSRLDNLKDETALTELIKSFGIEDEVLRSPIATTVGPAIEWVSGVKIQAQQNEYEGERVQFCQKLDELKIKVDDAKANGMERRAAAGKIAEQIAAEKKVSEENAAARAEENAEEKVQASEAQVPASEAQVPASEAQDAAPVAQASASVSQVQVSEAQAAEPIAQAAEPIAQASVAQEQASASIVQVLASGPQALAPATAAQSLASEAWEPSADENKNPEEMPFHLAISEKTLAKAIDDYDRALSSVGDDKSYLYENKVALLQLWIDSSENLDADAKNKLIPLLEDATKLIDKFNEFDDILCALDNKDNAIYKASRHIYHDIDLKIYELLKKHPPDSEEIVFLSKCIEDAIGAVRYQGTFTANRYIENLIQDARSAKSRANLGWRFASRLTSLAGAVIRNLGRMGISVPWKTSFELMAFSVEAWFLKDTPLGRLATQTQTTVPVVSEKPKPLWLSFFWFSTPKPNVISEDQKKLVINIIEAIQSNSLTDELSAALYAATTGGGEPKKLRHFFKQHIVPYLSNHELFLFVQAMMSYHVNHKEHAIFRQEDTLARELYEQFAERLHYKPNEIPQPPRMVVLNHLVLAATKNDRNEAIKEITFKLQYFSMKRKGLVESLENKLPSSSDFLEEEKKEIRTTELNKLKKAVSEDVLAIKEEKIIDFAKIATARKLDAIREMYKDKKLSPTTRALAEYIKIASTDNAEHRTDVEKIYGSLTSLDPKERLSKLRSLFDREVKITPDNKKYYDALNKFGFRLARNELEKISKSKVIEQMLEEGRGLRSSSLIAKAYLSPKIAHVLIMAGLIAHTDDAEEITSLTNAMNAITLPPVLESLRRRAQSIKPIANRPSPN